MNLDSILKASYDSLPSLHCGDCWGECCVSPTVTVAEFIYMMKFAQKEFSLLRFTEFLEQDIREHPVHLGNAHCRFQHKENGNCQVYPGRGMACRLHGHEALRAFETEEMVFCDKKPDHDLKLNHKTLEDKLETLRELNGEFGLAFEAPYYLVSLNIESWIDLVYLPEINTNRPDLLQLKNTIINHCELPTIPNKRALTTLSGHLNQIDKVYKALNSQDWKTALLTLKSTHLDYPSTGSFFLEESIWLAQQIANTDEVKDEITETEKWWLN
jgi:Fe-S-cluster containining protein